MSPRSTFGWVVGCATILGTIFAGISVKEDLGVYYTSAKETLDDTLRGPIHDGPGAAQQLPIVPPVIKPATAVAETKAESRSAASRSTPRNTQVRSQRTRTVIRTTRRTTPRRARPSRPRTVNWLEASKPIPHPTTNR